MAESKTTYGAIDVPGGNNEFDEKNTYYLNESRFNWNKFLRAAVPVVIALMIMGGFAYGMSHGFNHFYGPPKGSDDDIKRDESWIPLDNPKDDSGAVAVAPKAHGSSGTCATNEKCAALGLTGNCCPTNKGTTLECCN
eukprot:CAMPEP_0183705804 /NCGR_PEP_ID=MMETSP0737-20130205/2822_1 /TAXON_ID=385413 /ORGANISM="Thalassiosira miniscula, Strain CCMP1093" /LENGTH=137 /DNA_ID=CAMNT_0025933059 /DNA_START=21 /DNA_END=434 /DNA_ORIENTATION=+